MLGSPLFGQLAFDRSFQHRGSVSLQIRLGSLERRNPSIQVGEQFFDLRDDAGLLRKWSDRKPRLFKAALCDVSQTGPAMSLANITVKVLIDRQTKVSFV